MSPHLRGGFVHTVASTPRVVAVCECRYWVAGLMKTSTQHLQRNAIAHSWCYGRGKRTLNAFTTVHGVDQKKKKKIGYHATSDRTSRQTQAGIGHSAPAHRGGHMQNRISRRQVRRGKIEHSAEAEQPRTD